MALTKEIRELDEELHHVACDLDMTRINPTNAEAIKESYEGEDRPLIYGPTPDYTLARERMQALEFPNTPEGEMLREKRDYLMLKTALIKAAGTKEFTKISKKIYPPPSKELVRAAEEILEKPAEPAGEKVGMEEALKELERAIKKLKIPWEVERADMIASANVVPSKRRVYLKEKSTFSKRYIERLVIHEIGVHAVRAENGRLQPLKIFLHGLAGYLPTEEGLAVYNEELFGLLSHNVLRTYAGRVIAIDYAKNHTFSEVVERLKKYFSEKKALTIALRVKRGVAHGSEHGGYTKDSAYLKGYLALKEYEKRGGDLSPLYYGKVGLEDLKRIKAFTWLKKPRYSPETLRP